MQALILAPGLWRPASTRNRRRPGRACRRRRAAGFAVAALLLAAELSWPLAGLAQAASASGLLPLAAAELAAITGGCFSSCDGDDGSSDSGSSSPTKVGSPYWEYAYRTLISRPSVSGDLIWHRVNSTNAPWGPFEVTYRYRRTHNWSLGGSVPSSYVQAQVGSAYEISRTLVETFTVPAKTYYKFFVAYPYERWRHYYRKYQDYSDNTRDVLSSGTATVYDQWTKTNLVQGRVY